MISVHSTTFWHPLPYAPWKISVTFHFWHKSAILDDVKLAVIQQQYWMKECDIFGGAGKSKHPLTNPTYFQWGQHPSTPSIYAPVSGSNFTPFSVTDIHTGRHTAALYHRCFPWVRAADINSVIFERRRYLFRLLSLRLWVSLLSCALASLDYRAGCITMNPSLSFVSISCRSHCQRQSSSSFVV